MDMVNYLAKAVKLRPHSVNLTTGPVQGFRLQDVPPEDVDRVLARAYHLRTLCDVHSLDYRQVVDYACNVQTTCDCSWPAAFDEAIRAVQDLHIDRDRRWQRLEQINEKNRENEKTESHHVLDRPNPRLPFDGGHRR
jgi:hypothetical protein